MNKFWNWIRDDTGNRVLRLEGPIDEGSFWGNEITPQDFRSELEAEEGDQSHQLKIQRVEDEFYVTLSHEMTKDHYLSFIAAVRSDGLEVKKLYPEQAAEGRFKMAGIKFFYCYCNHHGLFKARAVL